MIKKIYDNLSPNSDFGKNVLTLLTGTTIAQAIPIAISPILTRLYTPSDFGLYALYVSLVSMSSVVSTGRYELAIMLPRRDKNAANILALSFLLSLVFSFILFLIVLLFNTEITKLLGNEDIGNWLYLLPMSVLFMGLFNTLNYWFNRKLKYKDLSKGRVLQSFTIASVNLSFGLLKLASGLIIANVIGCGIVVLVFIRKIKSEIIADFNFDKLKYLAKRYSKFPKFEMLSGFSNMASAEIPVLLLSSFFGVNIVGFYSLARRILSLPTGLIGGAIGQVFLQKSVTYKNDKDKLRELTFSTFKKLLFIGIPCLSVITVFGDYLFSFVFGAQWEMAGVYAQVLSLWLVFVFLGSPLSTLLVTLEKQKESLIFNLSIFIFRSLALCIGALFFNSPFIAIVLFTVIGSLFWISFLFYIFYLVGIGYLKAFLLLFGTIISVNSCLLIIRFLINFL